MLCYLSRGPLTLWFDSVVSMAAPFMSKWSWFTIVPRNDEATAIVSDAQNRTRVTPVRCDSAIEPAIIVPFSRFSNPDCILSFGSDKDCTVICEGEGYSRKQCHFFLLNDSLMIQDDSSEHSTRISPLGLDSQKWNISGDPR